MKLEEFIVVEDSSTCTEQIAGDIFVATLGTHGFAALLFFLASCIF
jgi:hypothetical protein